MTIDRKFREPVMCKLTTRLMLLTNELPRLADASGALASRFIVLQLRESFYGKEDHALLDRLLPELPGILRWSIEGWRRLRERGYFIQPESGRELVGELEDLTSPVCMFIRERCNVGAEFSVPIHELYAAWTHWSDSKGWKTSGTEQTFGRDLRAALPFISTRQPRNNFGERHREYIGIGLNHSASGTQWHASQPIVRVGES